MYLDKTNTNLFGEEVPIDLLLRDKFIEPPFSVLDTKQGGWQNRKRKWAELGIKGEVGRDSTVIHLDSSAENIKEDANYVSIFDPALTELMYEWFCPKDGSILDPFAGGSVRGIVANYLGYKYTGIELRQEQVASNVLQAEQIIPNSYPTWVCGDSDKELDKLDTVYDFVFSCPPYFDLEVYSELPEDLSNMSYSNFKEKYRSIIIKSLSKLTVGGFAVFVVGKIRDKDGFYRDFVGDTKRAFMENGAKFYNDIVLLNCVGSASMRTKQFEISKKVVKIHQNVLCFLKT